MQRLSGRETVRTICRSTRLALAAAAALLAVVLLDAAPVAAEPPGNAVVHYDAADEIEYQTLWANIYGPLSLAAGGTRTVGPTGITISAVPFAVGADVSVFDHLKYIAVSTRSFPVPEVGSLEFAVEIQASTPGTVPGRVVHGCYGPAFSYPSLDAPCAAPFRQEVFEGQQAGVVLNMINFETGQLFDWFVSGGEVFALIERLPTVVTGSPGTPLALAYTQIIRRAAVPPGRRHKVAIRYTRGVEKDYVEYILNGRLFARVDYVGIPLDRQGIDFTGYAPSLGSGEALKDRLDSFQIGHGLFSLLDAFPYQHPERPDLSVSIPLSERLFGQGARGTFDKFKVTTRVAPPRP